MPIHKQSISHQEIGAMQGIDRKGPVSTAIDEGVGKEATARKTRAVVKKRDRQGLCNDS